ncbi:GspE/PulE family protein [Guyparkeria hydrothermalis]|uniref:GspE/PulE family protein n=1 Tax=Guyparkeria hydrothermalis TaxID=923 RepID=UPI0020226B6F|nr:GspE/PulE family protein [Guyparkeria hydrothermalis]MCL7744208.1 GspE/PulE family protein [Guyparkeria hydrothermalis]
MVTRIGSEADINQALHSARNARVERLGEVLVHRGTITRDTLEKALEALKHHPAMHLGDWLVEHKLISPDQLEEALCSQLGIPQVNLGGFIPPPTVAALIPYEMALRLNVLPLARRNSVLVVACAKPTDQELLSILRFYTGLGIEPVLAAGHQITSAINRAYRIESSGEETGLPGADVQPNEQEPDIENQASSPPVVKMVNTILMQAISRGASDIHFLPRRENVLVRFRLSGALQTIRSIEKSELAAVVARIKILGRMNIAEHRLPQDGHARVHMSKQEVDLRISVMPTSTGESVVIRILNKNMGLKPLNALGFSKSDERVIRNLIARAQGMILVTGPTGSGKTTTLYSLLQEVKAADPHIITVEDPVEYDMDGVDQVQVHGGIGYTFGRALRNILRHDPDVIMIGEMRDLETAESGVKAALTGHLVFSTLHTNDAPSAVTRLVDMGVAPYLVSSTVMAVLAQRLVRILCSHCKKKHQPEALIKETMGVDKDATFWRSKGCDHCDHTGYVGRTMAYELIVVDRDMANHIAHGVTTEELRQLSVDKGMRTLTRHALEMALAGITSLEEAYRVRLEDLGGPEHDEH